jgi:hypothetical protein
VYVLDLAKAAPGLGYAICHAQATVQSESGSEVRNARVVRLR